MTERAALREKLRIKPADLEAVSAALSSPDNRLVGGLLDLVEKYGGVDAINRQADEAGRLETRIARLQDEGSPFLPGIEWLAEQRDADAFVTLPEYRRSVIGSAADAMTFDEARAVTLEISALQYFPWLIDQARQAIERRELMPGRYIRVRNIAEQSAPGEDILAVAAAMQIIGAVRVECLDANGIDGSNVHLGGPDTITGYFGGIGEPNDYPLKWADERLGILTKYGIRQVLNINSGTILVALLMHKLGIRNEFKVSVFMGVDNPWSVLWLLMGARLLAGDDGSTSLAGLNLSNSVEVDTLLAGQQAGAHQQPEHRPRVVDAHEHRHLELVADPQLVHQERHEDRAAVDVENLPNAILSKDAKALFGPFQRVVVGLTDAAEVAGDGVRAAQVDVGAVDATRVESLDVRGADDLHRGRHGEDVLARRGLLGDVAHADVAAGHKLALLDRQTSLVDEPGEVLEGADLESHGARLVEGHGVGRGADDAAPVLRQRHEGVGVALLGEPRDAGQER